MLPLLYLYVNTIQFRYRRQNRIFQLFAGTCCVKEIVSYTGSLKFATSAIATIFTNLHNNNLIYNFIDFCATEQINFYAHSINTKRTSFFQGCNIVFLTISKIE